NSKLDAQVYLPYTATIKENKVIKVSSTPWLDNYDENMLGAGQTWQNVTGQRRSGVTYTNTTRRPIALAFSSTVTVEVDGQRVTSSFFIIPLNATYKASSMPTTWLELR
ncbi:hypothetical protein, partial [Campylobacter hyointestinalis]